jgi:RNase H-like domain found in reverse transcriptase
VIYTCSGALLSFSPTWKSTQLVVFNSCTFKGAELNYPIHEKELLAIIQALKKWHTDLVESPFFIFTEYRMLENFKKLVLQTSKVDGILITI